MKTFYTALASFVLIFFLILALPISGEEQIYDSIVRLHVLPSGDSAEEQSLKIAVRDALLTHYGETLSSFESKEEAEEYLKENVDEIEAFVSAFLKENGSSSTVTVTVSEESFERRSYGELTLPAGTYTSLTVKLDGGEGQNWWCVLYPALCTEAAMGDRLSVAEEALGTSEYRLVTDSGYLVKFRTLEILEEIFGN